MSITMPNAFEFEEQENFDMFNDLTLNPRNDIMPNIVYNAKLPDNTTNPFQYAPTVYKYLNAVFGTLYPSSNFLIPTLIVKITSLNNVFYIGALGTSYGAQGDYIITSYTKDVYQYYNSYYGHTEYTNASESFSNISTLFFSNENKANNASYLDYDFNYQDFGRPFHINTNIPILLVDNTFDSNNQATRDYLNHLMTLDEYVASDEHIIGILNEKQPEVKPIVEYECKVVANQYTVNEYGEKVKTNAPTLYRGFRIKSRNPVSLYRIEGIEDGALKFGISFEDAEICYYSTDAGFYTWQSVIGSPTTLPFNFVWRYHDREELGTFYCADSIVTTLNIPTWNNKEDADDYNDGLKDITDAPNYDDISGNFTPYNPTGNNDDITEFGSVYTQAFFSQQYICTAGQLSEISNALYDTTPGGLFEDIKKGLEMYGDSVIDDIQGCMFFPFDVSTVITNTSPQPYIYFGGYKFDMQSNVKKIVYPNGFYDFGTIHLSRTFGTYRDFEPYTRLYVYLAYIGWKPLDIARYLDKDVNIRYYFDTRTGTCLAVLTANGVMVDYYNGQCGVSMPVTLTDFSRYAQTQIQTLLGINQPTNTGIAGSTASSFGQGLVESGAMSVGAFAGASLGVGAMVQGVKTAYGLSQNNINNFNKTVGGSSSMLNQFLPQECCFMFEIQDADVSPYHVSLQGLPSNASGSIGSFSGYLEVDSVNLICADATANEKAEIVAMLQNGVYI